MFPSQRLFMESKMSEVIDQVSPSIDALMQEFYIITHNLANVSTVGYKRRCNAFSRVLEAQGTVEETYSPGEIDLNTAIDFSLASVISSNLSFLNIFG